MKTNQSKILYGVSAALILLNASSYVHADDTEIFFGAPSGNGVIKNVLFILDKSGSMKNLENTSIPYDPTVDYNGDLSNDNWVYVYDGNTNVGSILLDQTHCQTLLTALADTGQYTAAQMVSYSSNGKKWAEVTFNNANNFHDEKITECADDRGVHGESELSADTYVPSGSNNSAPWISDLSMEITWGDIKAYTLYSANYLNWRDNYSELTIQKSRLEIMQDVISRMVKSSSGMNIGLMSFNDNDLGTGGGRVVSPMGYIEDVRADFLSKVNNLNANGSTPLAETLFEAMRYYQGADIFQGGAESHQDAKDINDASKYQSPIISECQPNKVILLTDGQPQFDANINDPNTTGLYKYYPDYKTNDIWTRSVIENTIGNCNGNCLDEVARYMNEHDLSANYSNDEDIQNVQTYTIGFYLQQAILEETALAGGGQYFEANSTEDLEDAIADIFNAFKTDNTTFVTPGVAVNTFNRLNHRDELYFSVFRPEANPQWAGNLKKYRLGADGTVYDLNGRSAIDSTTGFFKAADPGNSAQPGAHSWWSAAIDGDEIHLGGASENLHDVVANRNVFTYLGSSPNLDHTSNKIDPDNNLITSTIMGAPAASEQERKNMINWVRGMDVHDINGNNNHSDSHKQMMDPLHSAPVVVIYGGTEASPDTTVFLGDNQGFLHAIDGSETNNAGSEYFAFMPDELLANQADIYENSQVTAHPYGLDGAISVWVNDENGDNDLYDNQDFVYLYTGMRRGGRNYYALDVTDRNSPKFLWEIKGGSGGTSGFEELGQTWSKPIKTKVKMGSTVREVLIFGGGYDTSQDTKSTRSADSVGRAVYIVDAETGAKIWSATQSTFSQMQYSIPSNVKAIDVNADQIADQIYVGDMGGQVWRFDIDNENSSTNTLNVHGGVIANLSGSDAANNRRFYHAPDVSILQDNGGMSLAISIGSGWQAHPLDKNVVDRLFLIKSSDVLEAPINLDGDIEYVTLTEEDLYDATDNHLGDVSAVNSEAQQEAAYKEFFGYNDGEGNVTPPKEGWYITFTRSGEKALASTLTIDGQIYYTTYEPKTSSSGCTVTAGIPRLYHIEVSDATPVKNYDGIGLDTELTAPDREVKVLTTSSLPTSPQRLRVDGKDQLCIGTECHSLNREETITKTYWVQEE